MRGTESDVAGMISATSSMKTVSESRTVMPAGQRGDGCECLRHALHLHVNPASLLLTASNRRWGSRRSGGPTPKPLRPQVSSITLSDRGFCWKALCKLSHPNQSRRFNYINRLIGRVSETGRFFFFFLLEKRCLAQSALSFRRCCDNMAVPDVTIKHF